MVDEAAEFLTRSEDFEKKNLRFLTGFQKKELVGEICMKATYPFCYQIEKYSDVQKSSQKDFSKRKEEKEDKKYRNGE